jgi:hypothetical protein
MGPPPFAALQRAHGMDREARNRRKDGAELVGAVVARRHRVFELTASVEAARRVRRAGAIPVVEPPEQGFRQAPRSAL